MGLVTPSNTAEKETFILKAELIITQAFITGPEADSQPERNEGQEIRHSLQRYSKPVALLLLSAGMALAQATNVGRGAVGISNEAVTITRAVGIIVLIIGGLMAAFSEGHGRGGVIGMIFGLLIAFGAPTLATWLQSF